MVSASTLAITVTVVWLDTLTAGEAHRCYQADADDQEHNKHNDSHENDSCATRPVCPARHKIRRRVLL